MLKHVCKCAANYGHAVVWSLGYSLREGKNRGHMHVSGARDLRAALVQGILPSGQRGGHIVAAARLHRLWRQRRGSRA